MVPEIWLHYQLTLQLLQQALKASSAVYKAVWVRRSDAWQFYTSSDNKTVYTDKGYTELMSSIEAGEGFWVELNAPVNPVNLEVANYGGYTSSPQLSSMTSEWNIVGASKKDHG